MRNIRPTTTSLLISLMAIVASAICCLTATSCITDEEQPDISLSVGERCPDFSVTLLDGSTISTADLQGHTAVIIFFNTSCGDCARELPVVQQAYDRLKASVSAQPLFVCIARNESAATIENFWLAHSLTLPVSPQPDDAVYKLFANIGIPRIYIISPSGIITAKWSDSPMATADDICTAYTAAQ